MAPIKKTFTGEQSREDDGGTYVSLTHDPLDATIQIARVKSAKAGAVVLFAGKSLARSPQVEEEDE
jgi:molybdopterin synthase catalytic subunit